MSFLWVGNHPGIDFCNTEPIVDGSPAELLSGTDDLDAWLVEAGAPPVAAPATVETLEWCRRLRIALRAVVDPTRREPGAVADLNAVLAQVRATVAVASWAGQVRLVAPDAQDQRRLDVISLVLPAASLPRQRVRRCANAACVLLFFDTSKGGRRRWHDMATCGNQAKAATHYSRTRTLATA